MIARVVGIGILAAGLAVLSPLAVYAHVTVSPKTAQTGERVTFTVSVPNEKELATTELRLVVPDTLEGAQPTIVAGWEIETVGEREQIREITWSGGNIPAGQRADFTLKGQVPASAGKIEWKAYQTYADGKVVAWDQSESSHGHAEGASKESGPLSVTNISDEAVETTGGAAGAQGMSQIIPLGVGLIALIVAVFALARKTKK